MIRLVATTSKINIMCKSWCLRFCIHLSGHNHHLDRIQPMLPPVRTYQSAIASMLPKNNNQYLCPKYSSLDMNSEEILQGVHTAAVCHRLLVWDGHATQCWASLLSYNRVYNVGFEAWTLVIWSFVIMCFSWKSPPRQLAQSTTLGTPSLVLGWDIGSRSQHK